MTVIAEDGRQARDRLLGGGGRVPFDFFLEAERWKRFAARGGAPGDRSSSARSRRRPATMTVVLGPGWPGILLHEAIGHGLEGDFNRKGVSAFAGRLGQKVASELVTVVDDGTIPNRRGSLNVDDEGTPTGRTVLIENGVLTRLHAGQAQRAAHGDGAHRQRAARVVRAPADAAHDEHVHAGRRGRPRGHHPLGATAASTP